jgi:chromosome segregation ATPase
VNALSVQVAETEAKHGAATEEITALKSQIERSVRESEGRAAEIELLRSEASTQVLQLEKSLAEAKSEHETLKGDFQKCTAKTGDIFRVLREMRTAIHPEAEIGEEEDGQALDFSNRLIQELTTLRELFMSSYNDIKSLLNERTKLQAMVTELEKMNEELHTKIKRSQATLLQRIEDLEEANRALQSANDMGEETRSKLSSANDSLRQTLQLMKNRLQESEEENRNLKQELTMREIQSV